MNAMRVINRKARVMVVVAAMMIDDDTGACASADFRRHRVRPY